MIANDGVKRGPLNRRLPRRQLLRAVALGGSAAAFAAACSSGSNRKNAPDQRSVATPGGAVPAAVRQELVAAVGEDQFNTDGDKANLTQYVHNLGVTEPLVRLTESLGVEPLLATR